MKKTLTFLVVIALISGCEPTEEVYLFDENDGEKNNIDFYLDLVYQHAPVHYQDVDRTGSHGLREKADYIARYDFDGDLNAKNNLDKINSAF